MKIKTIWVSNQPEGIGHDTTEAYLTDAKENLLSVLRGYDAALIGQHLIMDGDDEDFDAALEAMAECLSHGDDDESPVFAEFRDEIGSAPLQYAEVVK